MRENRTSGSEGGEIGSTDLPYPYRADSFPIAGKNLSSGRMAVSPGVLYAVHTTSKTWCLSSAQRSGFHTGAAYFPIDEGRRRTFVPRAALVEGDLGLRLVLGRDVRLSWLPFE